MKINFDKEGVKVSGVSLEAQLQYLIWAVQNCGIPYEGGQIDNVEFSQCVCCPLQVVGQLLHAKDQMGYLVSVTAGVPRCRTQAPPLVSVVPYRLGGSPNSDDAKTFPGPPDFWDHRFATW